MEKYLNKNFLKDLRTQGVLSENEVAIEIGDLLVAENVISKDRRVIEKKHFSIQESIKRLLKG
tara:strand:+ start:2561 stop:2749 length:189 start_codon:yes stop_codon:yes gene_type:complete